MASPASPALSYGSSAAPLPEADALADFLVGFEADSSITAEGSLFDGPPTPREAPHELPAVAMTDSIDADVFRMYMADGLLDKFGQPAIAPVPTAIDPSLFQAAPLPPAPVVADPMDEDVPAAMDDDDDADDFGGEYREDGGDDSDAAPSANTRKGKGKAKAARKPAAPRKSSRSTRASSSQAKGGVASLAIPTDQSTYVPTEGSNRLPHIAFSAPDWIDKPSADDYKNLDSKQKRQIRNKISARNFRHRRTQYIGTLEESIAAKDRTIGTLREENRALTIRLEDVERSNAELRTQFAQFMARSTQGPAAACSSEGTPALTPASTASTPQPNLLKDIAASSAWGPGGLSGMGGRDVGVHHTWLPERYGVGLDGKPLDKSLPLPSPPLPEQRNVNPLLDGISAADLAAHTFHMRSGQGMGIHHPFTASSFAFRGSGFESARAQLYPKVFHNASVGQSRGVTAPTTKPAAPAPAGFRPAFFSAPSSLSGKPSSFEPSPMEAAYVAELASSTLVSRLGTAFMHAFAGTPPSTTLDPRKVEAVLRGTSRVEVVPMPTTPVDELSSRIGALNVDASTSPAQGASCITAKLFSGCSKRA